MLFTGEKQLMELTDTEILMPLYQFQHTDGWQQPDNREAEIMSPGTGECRQRLECRAAAGMMQKHNSFGHLLTHPLNTQKSTYVPVPRRLRMGQGSLFLYLWSVWWWLIPNSPDEAPLWICGPDLYSVEAWNELFAS